MDHVSNKGGGLNCLILSSPHLKSSPSLDYCLVINKRGRKSYPSSPPSVGTVPSLAPCFKISEALPPLFLFKGALFGRRDCRRSVLLPKWDEVAIFGGSVKASRLRGCFPFFQLFLLDREKKRVNSGQVRRINGLLLVGEWSNSNALLVRGKFEALYEVP